MELKDIISSGLLEMYVAGIATEQEALQVQQWVETYPEVAAEVSAIEQGIEAYSKVFTQEPNPSVKQKIFASINDKDASKVIPLAAVNKDENLSNTDAKVVGITSYWKNIAAAAAVLLLGSAATNVYFFNKNISAQNELSLAQQELGGLKDKARAMEDDMHVVQSKYSQPVALSGQEAAPDAAAKIFWMKNTGEVYIDPTNLPEAPNGMQYQLWAFVDGKPVDAGLIITSKTGKGYRIQKMKTFGKVEAFAVTLEIHTATPATEPHGKIFVMGKML